MRPGNGFVTSGSCTVRDTLLKCHDWKCPYPRCVDTHNTHNTPWCVFSFQVCVSKQCWGVRSSWPPFAPLFSPRVVSHAWFYLFGVWVFFVVGLGHCLFFCWFTFACILSPSSAFVGLPLLSFLCVPFPDFASVDLLWILYLVHVCCSFGSRFASGYLMGVWWIDFRLAPIRVLLSMVSPS